jgi:AbrB family looped-hinge helix DNA binding protein
MAIKTVQLEPGNKVALGRIGQRGQVVIPKAILDALRLKEGDFVEITTEGGRVHMKPKKLIDAEDVLTPEEEKRVRKGEAQLKRGQSKPWHAVKNALAR